jgi:hypothetical protein
MSPAEYDAISDETIAASRNRKAKLQCGTCGGVALYTLSRLKKGICPHCSEHLNLNDPNYLEAQKAFQIRHRARMVILALEGKGSLID